MATEHQHQRSELPKQGQAGTPSRPVDEAENGVMTQNMEDVQRLGRDMEQMRTNAELEEEGLVPDPIQD